MVIQYLDELPKRNQVQVFTYRRQLVYCEVPGYFTNGTEQLMERRRRLF